MTIMRTPFWLFIVCLALTGCGRHNADQPSGQLPDEKVVLAQLNQQLNEWKGTRYRLGGMNKRGIDCSAFVYRTFKDRFAIRLPRTTTEQTNIGSSVSRSKLTAGDLVFFKTGSGPDGLHVGIYYRNDQFIHASTSQGVTKSSLNNVYWKKAYWKSRRLE